MSRLLSLLQYIEKDFKIDDVSDISYNLLNQEFVRVSILKSVYSIVDNENGMFELAYIYGNEIVTFQNVSADDIIAIVSELSNNLLIDLMKNRCALKHLVVKDEIKGDTNLIITQ